MGTARKWHARALGAAIDHDYIHEAEASLQMFLKLACSIRGDAEALSVVTEAKEAIAQFARELGAYCACATMTHVSQLLHAS